MRREDRYLFRLALVAIACAGLGVAVFVREMMR